MTQREPDHQHRERHQQPGDRPGGANVEQLAAVRHDGAQPDERPHGADRPRDDRCRDEERQRHVELVVPGRDVMTQLVAQEDGEQGCGEGEPLGPGVDEVPRERVRAEQQRQRVRVERDRAQEHGAHERGREQCGREEQQVYRPGVAAAPPDRAGEDQVPSVRLVGPVVAAGPVGERSGQRRRRAGVRRMYKRVNHFPVGQGGGAPGEEVGAQVHGRT